MNPTVYLLTGANRGLGLEILRILASDENNRIIATARDPSTAIDLQEIIKKSEGRVIPLRLDQSSLADVQRAFKEVSSLEVIKEFGLDVLWLDAGVNTGDTTSASKINYDDLQSNITVNIFGTIYVTNTFLPLLRAGKGKKIVYVSTAVASITLGVVVDFPGEYGAYGVSKAGANFFFARLNQELEAKKEGFTILAYHPGYISTDMNKNARVQAELTPVQAAEYSVKLVKEKTIADSGKFWHYSGSQIPW